jgi:HEAT repeat protein
MTLRLDLPEMPLTDLVTLLGDPHRAFRAYARLLALGPEATEAARGGLAHPDERVREQCCKILDHLMDADSIPLLIGPLADPCERVRVAAVHALACDRCKTGACRPTPEAVLPTAVGLLADDPSPSVRKKASWYDLGGTIYERAAPRPGPGPRRRGR